jgi:hypothetical protein
MLRICCALVALVFLSSAVEARPHKRAHYGLPWCGIYMTQYKHIPKRSLWIARNWAYEGTNAGGPGIGVIVVWRHHVGVITGRAPDGEWIVHSGNDGGRIRTRARSVAGAIAFRHV